MKYLIVLLLPTLLFAGDYTGLNSLTYNEQISIQLQNGKSIQGNFRSFNSMDLCIYQKDVERVNCYALRKIVSVRNPQNQYVYQNSAQDTMVKSLQKPIKSSIGLSVGQFIPTGFKLPGARDLQGEVNFFLNSTSTIGLKYEHWTTESDSTNVQKNSFIVGFKKHLDSHFYIGGGISINLVSIGIIHYKKKGTGFGGVLETGTLFPLSSHLSGTIGIYANLGSIYLKKGFNEIDVPIFLNFSGVRLFAGILFTL